MSKHVLVLAVLAVLAALVLAYFVFIIVRASSLAGVLLRRGYDARGWTLPRLTMRMRVIGIAGALLSAAALVLAISKLVG